MMIFKTKRDRFFTVIWIVALVIVNIILLIPQFMEPFDVTRTVVLLAIEAAVSAFLIWLAADIRYVIGDDYLVVRDGPFRSKIKYGDITKVTGNPNIWMGYRLLASKDAIEIHYRTGLFGSVIISPEQKQTFVQELLKKNSNIHAVQPL